MLTYQPVSALWRRAAHDNYLAVESPVGPVSVSLVSLGDEYKAIYRTDKVRRTGRVCEAGRGPGMRNVTRMRGGQRARHEKRGGHGWAFEVG